MTKFENEGTEPVRIGFTGERTANVKKLLASQDSAFSITEIAKEVGVDMTDSKAKVNLKNLLYGLRRKGKVELRMVGGEAYYRAIDKEPAVEDDDAEDAEDDE